MKKEKKYIERVNKVIKKHPDIKLTKKQLAILLSLEDGKSEGYHYDRLVRMNIY